MLRGQATVPAIAVVSRRLDLDWSSPFFTDAEEPPIVIAPTGAGEEALTRASTHSDVIVAGNDGVDLAAALTELRARGAGLVVGEGGPTLNAQLLQAGLVDELCVSRSPALVGLGGGAGITGGAPLDGVRPLTLAHVLEEDGFLFVRYLLQNPEAPDAPAEADPTTSTPRT